MAPLAKSSRRTPTGGGIDGPCGGMGIYNWEPARHWCKMDDVDLTMHVLAGRPLYDFWSDVISSGTELDEVWRDGAIALKREGRDGYSTVVLNSKCRWKEKKK